MHMWSVAQCLLRLGHKVIIISHAYGARNGVRIMTNGLKVYYVPWRAFHEDNSFPTFVLFFPLFREIMIREGIEIVHGHGAASSLMHETMQHAKTMGLKTCYTDHSLFGFDDIGGIHLNKVLRFTFANIDRAIAVSHVCRENLVLRVKVEPERVYTIPNAVDCSLFKPIEATSSGHWTNSKVDELDIKLKPEILQRLKDFLDPEAEQGRGKKGRSLLVVYLGRLAYRKGIDLLARVIHQVCVVKPHMHQAESLSIREDIESLKFIVAGDGPKRVDLAQLIEKHSLQQRVCMVGAVPYSEVRKILILGDLFINCSLTESFGSAIVEAAACGLFIVSTGVGGVPEILPPSIMCHTQKRHDVDEILCCLQKAIRIVRQKRKPPDHGAIDGPHATTFEEALSPMEQHRFVKSLYNWRSVASRTVKVYEDMYHDPAQPLSERLQRHYSLGRVSGFGAVVLVVLDVLVYQLLQLFCPESRISKVPAFEIFRKRPG